MSFSINMLRTTMKFEILIERYNLLIVDSNDDENLENCMQL